MSFPSNWSTLWSGLTIPHKSQKKMFYSQTCMCTLKRKIYKSTLIKPAFVYQEADRERGSISLSLSFSLCISSPSVCQNPVFDSSEIIRYSCKISHELTAFSHINQSREQRHLLQNHNPLLPAPLAK